MNKLLLIPVFVLLLTGCTKPQEVSTTQNNVIPSAVEESHEETTQEATTEKTNILYNEDGSIDTSNWQTYTNEEYGFSVKYPEGWGTDVIYHDGLKGYPNPNCLENGSNIKSKNDLCSYPVLRFANDQGYGVSIIVLSIESEQYNMNKELSINSNKVSYQEAIHYDGPDIVHTCTSIATFTGKSGVSVNLICAVGLDADQVGSDQICKNDKQSENYIFYTMVDEFELS